MLLESLVNQAPLASYGKVDPHQRPFSHVQPAPSVHLHACWHPQILAVLTLGYVLEPLLTQVYMRNILTGAEKVLSTLRWGAQPCITHAPT